MRKPCAIGAVSGFEPPGPAPDIRRSVMICIGAGCAKGNVGRGIMGRKYQSILETIGNTPVVRINRLAPKGVNLFVKIEAFNPLGSVKDRLALGVIEAAEKSGE